MENQSEVSQQFEEAWKILEPLLHGQPSPLSDFKEIAFRAFIEGYKKGFYSGVDSPFYEPPTDYGGINWD